MGGLLTELNGAAPATTSGRCMAQQGEECHAGGKEQRGSEDNRGPARKREASLRGAGRSGLRRRAFVRASGELPRVVKRIVAVAKATAQKGKRAGQAPPIPAQSAQGHSLALLFQRKKCFGPCMASRTQSPIDVTSSADSGSSCGFLGERGLKSETRRG